MAHGRYPGISNSALSPLLVIPQDYQTAKSLIMSAKTQSLWQQTTPLFQNNFAGDTWTTNILVFPFRHWNYPVRQDPLPDESNRRVLFKCCRPQLYHRRKCTAQTTWGKAQNDALTVEKHAFTGHGVFTDVFTDSFMLLYLRLYRQ